MYKKENPLSKKTLTYRPTKEVYAFFKQQSELTGESINKLLSKLISEKRKEAKSQALDTLDIDSLEEPTQIKKRKFDSIEETDLETKKVKGIYNLTIEDLQLLSAKKSNPNLVLTDKDYLVKKEAEHKTNIEKVGLTAKNEIHQKIHAENIVIPASPELKKVFASFDDHNKKNGEIKYTYELLHIAIKREIRWGREPKIEKDLLKKALSKDYLNKPK